MKSESVNLEPVDPGPGDLRPVDLEPLDQTDPTWFRGPTPREHRIAAGLFVGFAVFFVLLFIVMSGSWFRWVFLGLGGYSFLDGVRHWREARRPIQ